MNPRKPQFSSDGILHATFNHHRFHLRHSTKGDHLLWINGQQPPLILDDTAADFVTYLVEGMWLYQHGDGDESSAVAEFVVDKMYRKYHRPLAIGKGRVTKERIRADLNRLYGTLISLAEGKCPVELGIDGKPINYGDWTAPARMDLAVTYKCNLKCDKCYVGDIPQIDEFSTDQWLQVFEKLWKAGIPQLVFTGGEPTIRPDLVQLISEADEFVTGLVTNGTRLAGLAESLRDASLDYVQVTIESPNCEVHDAMTGVPGSHSQTTDGIRKAQEAGLQVVTNTTLTKLNAPDFASTVRWLHGELGVTNVACNTLICSGRGTDCQSKHGLTGEELKSILGNACRTAEELGVNLQWYSPTCYTQFNPLEFEFGVKACSAAAHNMTVQPDGSVLPCQSWPSSVGNILTDEWKSIWESPVCLQLRKHGMATDECKGCSHFQQCGGGCPLDKTQREKTA